MKTHLPALTALFLLLATTACQKKPTASFSSDKEDYTNRETVYLTNTSTEAYFYTWIVKGPGTEEIRSSKENFSFELKQAGTYDISLSVYSKNGKLVSSSSKSINSKTQKSSYVFYTDELDNSSFKNVSIYIDNQYAGMLVSNYFLSSPTCGTPKTLTIEIPDGVHDMRFTFGPINHHKVYNGSVFVGGAVCSPYFIYK